MTMTKNDAEKVALAYIEGCGRKDWDAVAPLLAADIRVVGPSQTISGATPYMAVLRRLGAVWLRSEVKKVFVDGPDVCVVYDFVTDTPAGSVPIVEWMRVENRQIAAIHLVFDRVAFKPASEELARRAG